MFICQFNDMIQNIIIGVIMAIVLILLLKQTGKTDHFSYSLKCPNCGSHKGILKCVQCEDKKEDKWR